MAADQTQLKLDQAIGFNGFVLNGLIYHPNGKHIIYPLGSALVVKSIQDKGDQRFFQGHTDDVSCITVSYCGKYIASGQKTNQGFRADIIVWNFETGAVVYKFAQHMVLVKDLAFSHDSKYLSSIGGEDDRRMVVWDLETGKPIGGTLVGNERVNCVTFYNTRNDRIVTGGFEKIKVWEIDYESRKIDFTPVNLAQLKRDIVSMVIGKDDKSLYCGTLTGDVLHINLNTKLFRQAAPAREGLLSQGILSLLVLPDGALLFGSGKGVIGVMKDMRIVHKLKEPLSGGVTSLALANDEDNVYIGTMKANIYTMELSEFVPKRFSTAHCSAVHKVVFPKGYSEVFATCSMQDICIWNVETNEQLLKITEKNLDCLCVAFSADGKQILSGWSDGRIRSYGPQTGRKLYTIENAHDRVTAIASTNDSKNIISGGSEGMVRFWEITQSYQRMVASMKEHKALVSDLAVRQNDAECISAAGDGSCIIWDLSRFVRSQTFLMPNFFRAVGYLNDESQVVTTGSDRKIVYWDPYDGSAIRELEGSISADVNTLAISPSGRYLVTGGGDRLLKVWNYDEGTIAAVGVGHAEGITCAVFSPDRKLIVSTSVDGGIFIWENLEEVD